MFGIENATSLPYFLADSASLWSLCFYVWKWILSILLVISYDAPSKESGHVCLAIALLAITAYVLVYFYTFYRFNIHNRGSEAFFFRHSSRMMLRGIAEYPQIEIKYVLIQNCLFLLGLLLLFVSIIFNLAALDIHHFIPLWYTLCSAPIFIAIVMFQIWLWSHDLKREYSLQTATSLIRSVLIVWILVCVILRNDFEISIHSLFVSIPVIVLFVYFDNYLMTIPLRRERTIWVLSGVERCGYCCWTVFVVLWCVCTFVDGLLVAYTMIPIWLCWIAQALLVLLIIFELTDPRRAEYLLTEDYGAHIMVSSFSSPPEMRMLHELNDALQTKSVANGAATLRSRNKGIITDIVSPNHVAFSRAEYETYAPDEVNTAAMLGELAILHRRVYAEHESDGPLLEEEFYQWIPTEFQVTFKNDIVCTDANEMKNEFMEIKLHSWYIPDINQFQYPTLNGLILQILQTKIVPLFVCSMVGNRDQNCMEYKQCLFDWCQSQKILKIVVKSQQYEMQNDSRWDWSISRHYHVEGTLTEKISHIAIVYTHIDDRIYGGNLNLAFDSLLRNVWSFRPRSSSCIVFPNMQHKISKIELSRWGANTMQKRRILSFFLCGEEERFRETRAFDAFQKSDPDRDESSRAAISRINDLLMEFPLLTASDVWPFDRVHCEQLLEDTMQRFCTDNVPHEVIAIIAGYLLDDALLRDESAMQQNAVSLRSYRRDFNRYEQARRPMMLD